MSRKGKYILVGSPKQEGYRESGNFRRTCSHCIHSLFKWNSEKDRSVLRCTRLNAWVRQDHICNRFRRKGKGDIDGNRVIHRS